MKSEFEDSSYWNSYYSEVLGKGQKLVPSPFAVYLLDSATVIKGQRLVELGCGTGRDSVHFARNGVKVLAIDQCPIVAKSLNDHDNIIAKVQDFTGLENQAGGQEFDVVYSRFTMHSIDSAGELRTLKWAFQNLKPGGRFCIEARSINDPLCGMGVDKGNNIWFYNKHHRRFIVFEEFCGILENIGFVLELKTEANGLAPHREEDPIVVRLIARRP